MTVGELKKCLETANDEDEVDVYVAYDAILSASGRGHREKGYIVKDVEHVATRCAEGMVVLTTASTTNKALVISSKEITRQDSLHEVSFNT